MTFRQTYGYGSFTSWYREKFGEKKGKKYSKYAGDWNIICKHSTREAAIESKEGIAIKANERFLLDRSKARSPFDPPRSPDRSTNHRSIRFLFQSCRLVERVGNLSSDIRSVRAEIDRAIICDARAWLGRFGNDWNYNYARFEGGRRFDFSISPAKRPSSAFRGDNPSVVVCRRWIMENHGGRGE